MYLAWFDANPKKPVAQKIAEAHERYVEKFGRKPLVCLVNPEDVIQESAVELRPLKYIGRNCFWIGADDSDPAAQESAALAMPDAPRAPRTRKPKAEPDTALDAPAVAVVPEALPVVAAPAPRTRKPRVAQAAPAVAAAAPEVQSSAPRNRKAKASQGVPTIAPVAAIVPEVLASAPRGRKPKAAPVASPVVHTDPTALSSSPRGRKPKAAPVAPPASAIAPEPTIVPAPKRRTRREKTAA